MRAICGEAGVSARYFYESFTDKDQLVAAVFDGVIADIAATTQAAIAAAPRDEQTRAGIANLVRTIADDARIGRLLFNRPPPIRWWPASASRPAACSPCCPGQHVTTAYGLPDDDWMTAAAHFIVGGVAQTISAWVSGDVGLSEAQLVAQLAGILDGLTARNLDRS